MKTFALRQFVKIKAVFITDGETAGKMEQVTVDNSSNSVASNPETTVLNSFQRKAHTGNFFAGPHCVFDPRLF